MVHDGKDDWRSDERDLLSMSNQLVSKKRKSDNKAAHTTAANARLFQFEPTENKDLRLGGKA